MFAVIYRDQFHDQGLTRFSDKTDNMAVTSRFDVISVNLRINGDKIMVYASWLVNQYIHYKNIPVKIFLGNLKITQLIWAESVFLVKFPG